jgi:Domain of unknown function (DUF4288)
MAYIPKDTVWYIAQEVMEIIVEGEARNVVHINYLLVRAESPEDAYEKALRLGAEHETTYLNKDKKGVRISFRGLHNLTPVYEDLEHGAELLYVEEVGISEERLDGLIRSKQSLGTFRPIEKSSGPDYGSEEIRRKARSIVRKARSIVRIQRK